MSVIRNNADLAPRLKTFFMLNSTEHEFFLLINVKTPTDSILGLSEPKKA